MTPLLSADLVVPLFAAVTLTGLAAGTVTHLLTALVSVVATRWLMPGPPAPNPAAGINLAIPAKSASLDAFVSFFRAIESANGPKILEEARFLSQFLEQEGGFAAMLDDAFDQILEARLADPATKAPLLSQIAAAHGVTGRQLLDALEGKPASPAPATTSSAPTVTSALIGLLVCLVGSSCFAADHFGSLSWGADVKAPQHFYAHDNSPRIDQPLMQGGGGELVRFDTCPVPDPGPNVFVDYFYTDTCAPCRLAAPQVARWEQSGRAKVIYRNVGTESGKWAIHNWHIQAVPTFIVSVDGRETLRTSDPAAVERQLAAPRAQAWPAESVAYVRPVYRATTAPFRFIGRLFGRCR